MMEDQINKDYFTGFNEGYIMTRHLPILSDKIAAIEKLTTRLEGFKDGRRELTLEQARANRPTWKSATQHNIDQENKERDKGLDPNR